MVVQAAARQEAAPAESVRLVAVTAEGEGPAAKAHAAAEVVCEKVKARTAIEAAEQAAAAALRVGTFNLFLCIAQDWSAEMCSMLCCCQA